jgi:hypothetical protein
MDSDLGERLRGCHREDLTNEEWPARTQASPGVGTPMPQRAWLPGHRYLPYLSRPTRSFFLEESADTRGFASLEASDHNASA